MIRTVVVRAVTDYDRKSKCISIRTYEMVGSRFGSGIRRTRIVRCLLCEELLGVVQLSVYLIGRDVVKTFSFGVVFPMGNCCIQQRNRAYDIRLYKLHGIRDAAIYVRLGSQVNDSCEIVFLEKRLYKSCVCNVSFLKRIIWKLFYIAQVLEVSCICEFIEIHDMYILVCSHKMTNHV